MTDWKRNIQVTYNVEIVGLAENDLEDIGDYIAFVLMNPQASLEIIKEIRNKINKLQTFPERNKLDDDKFLADIGVRIDYYKNYKIYYLVDYDKKTVYIIRIMHVLVDSNKILYKMFGKTN